MTIFNSFADLLESNVCSIFAVSAKYAPVIGGSVSCKVVIEKNAFLQPDAYDARFVETGVIIEALVSEVGEPQKGSIFTIDSIAYTVQKIETNDGRFIRLVVT